METKTKIISGVFIALAVFSGAYYVSATSKADEIMHKIPYSITLNPDSDFNLVL